METKQILLNNLANNEAIIGALRDKVLIELLQNKNVIEFCSANFREFSFKVHLTGQETTTYNNRVIEYVKEIADREGISEYHNITTDYIYFALGV
jgi:hypothetical protein